MTPLFLYVWNVSGVNHGLASIILPKLKKGPFNFLTLPVDYFFQKVYFSLYRNFAGIANGGTDFSTLIYR